jgi:hypothetical protein
LTTYNFKGKTVVPFCTHGGGGVQNVYTDMAKLLPDSEILKGLEVFCRYENGLPVMGGKSYNSQGSVEKWIKELNVFKTK